MNPGNPSYDQIQIFLAVCETGSFGAAARRLGRAVSVISYGVAQLETQLGLTLFAREGTRKPQLTEAGRAVLAEARVVAQGMDGLRARVKGLLTGLEAEVRLAVDVMLPAEQLAHVLRGFQEAFPTVALRLHVEALGAVTALVLSGAADVGLSGPLASANEELERRAAWVVPMVPVAAPSHPLAQTRPLPPGAGADHIQLVLTDRSPLTQGQDFAVFSPHTWRLADLGSKHALLREGVGWGNMPLPMVRADLASGALVRLDMPDDPGGIYRLFAIHRRDITPGPAARWLLKELVDSGQAADVWAGPEI